MVVQTYSDCLASELFGELPSQGSCPHLANVCE